MAHPRYLIGIDLGTTHTALAYIDTAGLSVQQLETAPIQLFSIEQLVNAGEVAAKPLLPSFRFHPSSSEINEHDMYLPWRVSEYDRLPGEIEPLIVGEWARELGSKVERTSGE